MLWAVVNLFTSLHVLQEMDKSTLGFSMTTNRCLDEELERLNESAEFRSMFSHGLNN
jgi:hypothetical protein